MTTVNIWGAVPELSLSQLLRAMVFGLTTITDIDLADEIPEITA